MSFNYELTVEVIQSQAESLVEFHSKYAIYFQTKTRDNSVQALGLRPVCFRAGKESCDSIDEKGFSAANLQEDAKKSLS